MSGDEHKGHRKRMRERFAQNGLEGFAPHEVLELLLFHAVPRQNVNPLAHQLIKRFGSLGALMEATPDQLRLVGGVGEQTATLLSLVLPIARYLEKDAQGGRPLVTNQREARDYCRRLFTGRPDEVLYVICLDAQGRVQKAVPAIQGTIDEIPIYPRTVLEVALFHHAHSVVLAHNHPSGVLEPSPADVETTQRLTRALGEAEIQLMDHIIYADGECISMKRWLSDRRQPVQFPVEAQQPRAADRKRGAKKKETTKQEDHGNP